MNFYNEDSLKNYQKEALSVIVKDFSKEVLKNNTKRKVVVAPTGSGKTFMMYAFMEKILDMDKSDEYRFVLITHSLQMAKSFKDDIKKLNTSIYTFEDLENKVSRLNDKVVLLNPEKINTDSGAEYLEKWKRANKNKKVILIMDEADITHDGKRNRELIEIMRPKYELGFTATFDEKKDYKKSIESNREPSSVIYTVSLDSVKEEEVVVKSFESIIDTKGVSINSIIQTALKKQCDIYEKTKSFNDSYIPRILIQTNAHKALDTKEIVLNESKKIDCSLHKVNNYNLVGVITSDTKEFNEEDKEKYLVIIGDGIVSRGWDYPEIKIVVAEKNSVDVTVGAQLLGRASRMPGQFYRENDLLNNGYIYIAGNHSIEKSGEMYGRGVIFETNNNHVDVVEKEEVSPKDISQPNFKTWVNDFEDNYIENNEEEYEELVDSLISIVKNAISEAQTKKVIKKEVKRFNYQQKSESLGVIDLKIDSNYAMQSIKDFLYKRLPSILVKDAFSDKKLRVIDNYEEIYESIIQILDKDEGEHVSKLMNKIKYKAINFKFNTRAINPKKSTKYSRSLYEEDDSMNEEEKSFAAILNDYCTKNDKHWVRNREKKDIRLPLGYYPDFVVFDDNDYFMVEYKGKHLKDSQDSIRKRDYGLNNDDVTVLMVIQEDGFKIGKHDKKFSNFTSENVNLLLKLSKL